MNHAQREDATYTHDVEVNHFVDLANAIGMSMNTQLVADILEETDLLTDLVDPRDDHASTRPMTEVLKDFASKKMDDTDIMVALSECQDYQHIKGIYLNVCTPAPRTPIGRTWDLCRVVWVYGDTYEQAFANAVEWAKEIGNE